MISFLPINWNDAAFIGDPMRLRAELRPFAQAPKETIESVRLTHFAPAMPWRAMAD